jgi:hypothetical protein
MKLFVIEREIPRVGSMERKKYREAARRSNEVLAQLGPEIEWVESLVGDDRLYCIYRATDESLIHRHAELSGFPANRVTEIRTILDPATADGTGALSQPSWSCIGEGRVTGGERLPKGAWHLPQRRRYRKNRLVSPRAGA